MNRYSFNFYPKKDNPRWNDQYILRKIAPYDDAEYFWAYTCDLDTWTIIYRSKKQYTVHGKTKEDVVDLLEEHNRTIPQIMVHN